MLATLLGAAGVPYRFAVPSEADGHGYVKLLAGHSRAGEGTTVELPPPPEPLLRGLPWTSAGNSSALAPLFAALSREEEYKAGPRDRYERFLLSHTAIQPAEAAARPLVSEYAATLLSALRDGAVRSGLPFVRMEPWPGGRPMAACLTHDVDTVRRGKLPRGVAVRDVRAMLGSAARGRLGEAGARMEAIGRAAISKRDPYWTFDHIAALEREHGFRSTYFVMSGRLHPEDASYDPADPGMRGLMDHLAESGCEIGLHGSFGPYHDPGALFTQKQRIEAIIGRPISGHRNHVLRFRVPDSWRAHRKAGFSYDATLGFADHEGYRGCHSFPFHPYDLRSEQALELLEIPLAVMDVTIHKYRALRSAGARAAIEKVLGETLVVGGLASLLWHNDTFYEPDYPGCGALYEYALDWLATQGAWVAPCGAVDRWWRARESVSIEPLPRPGTGWEVATGAEIDGLSLEVTLPEPAPPPRAQWAEAVPLGNDGRRWRLVFGKLPAGSRLPVEL